MSSLSTILNLKWIFLFIIAIVFLAIFFIGYGEFFIPLALAAGILFFGMNTPMGKNQPLYVAVLALFAFIAGYFLQRLQISTVSNLAVEPLSLPFDTNTSLIMIGAVIVLLFLLLPRKERSE